MVVLSAPGHSVQLGQGAHWPPTPSLGFTILNSSASLVPPGRTISFSEDSPCVPTVPPAAHDLGPSTTHFQMRKLEGLTTQDRTTKAGTAPGCRPSAWARAGGPAHAPSSPLGDQAQRQAPPPRHPSLNPSRPLQAGSCSGQKGALPSPALSAPTSGPTESPGQGQSPSSSLGPPSPRGSLSPRPGQPHPCKHRESTGPRLTLVGPRGAPSATSGRAGPPAAATGWLGAGTDLVQERVPSRWARAHSPGWAGLGDFPPLYAPSQSIPGGRQYHQPTWEIGPCTQIRGGGERRGKAFRPPPLPISPSHSPPHQTQDGGFPGLSLLSQRAPSHPPGLMDGR